MSQMKDSLEPAELRAAAARPLDEYACQRQLIDALGISDEREISQQLDPGRRLRQLARLNQAKACLKRQFGRAGMTGKAVAMALAELAATPA